MFVIVFGITFLNLFTIVHLSLKLKKERLLYHSIIRKQSQSPAKTNSSMLKKTISSSGPTYDRYSTLKKELLIYVLAVILCRIWSVVDRFEILFDMNTRWIDFLNCFFSPLQGFVNTLLFFNNYSIRQRIRKTPFIIHLFGASVETESQPLLKSPLMSNSSYEMVNEIDIVTLSPTFRSLSDTNVPLSFVILICCCFCCYYYFCFRFSIQ